MSNVNLFQLQEAVKVLDNEDIPYPRFVIQCIGDDDFVQYKIKYEDGPPELIFRGSYDELMGFNSSRYTQ